VTDTHAHGDLDGPALLDAAREALAGTGEQWTPMRESVFRALAGFDKPASAYDITDALSRSEGRRVAANSVYRILDLLVRADVAQRIESKNAFLVNAHPGCRHDCIFLICDVCGRTLHIDDDAIGRSVRRSAEGIGFAAQRPILEVRGTCSQCQPDTQAAA